MVRHLVMIPVELQQELETAALRYAAMSASTSRTMSLAATLPSFAA